MSSRAASVIVPMPEPGVIGTSFAAAHSIESLLAAIGTQTGGCGFCTGRGRIEMSS